MRILTRYILKEVLSHAAIGIAVFTFILFMQNLGRILELVVRKSAPLPSVAEIFLFTLPTALTVTIPMGVLVGILIGLSRLAADSEVTAIRASGLGTGMFVRVLSIFVFIAWILALYNNATVAPRSAAALSKLQDKLKSSQASFEVQPRVFYEDFPNMVMYVQDVSTAAGGALWRQVFLADVSTPSAPKITLAREGVVVSESPDTLHLHLTTGSTHEVTPQTPEQYEISTFSDTDAPIQLPASDKSKEPPVLAELSTRDLWRLSSPTQWWYQIEFHRRLALPTACIVLALVGIPLGLSAKKGGKSTGFVMTILLVFLYYLVSMVGVSLAKQQKLPPGPGVWMANGIFLIAGFFLLWKVDRRPIELGSLRSLWNRLRHRVQHGPVRRSRSGGAFERALRRSRLFRAKFPLILDDLILRDFGVYLGMILSTFLVLMLVFTFFELLGDIVRNRVPLVTVGEYLLNVTPYFVYNTTPMCVLLAVLITFGLMQKANEITAMKASGISVYRTVLPVLLIASLLAGGLFFFDQFYLPKANKRQDALRNRIKGKPAQTYLRPDRRWIFGSHSTIYYYEFFDADANRFASISAFEFDPHTFELTRRVYANRAHWADNLHKWVFEQGWERSFHGAAIADYRTFDVSTFAELDEPPQYFKKEVKQSSEMNYAELDHYIHDLQQSGFDVIRLRVQLQKKFAYPLITLVMAVLAIPFSLSAARRGALTGVAVAVGIAVVYWMTSGLFEAMGNMSQLPPALAAWSPDVLFALAGGYLILKVPT